MRYSLTGRAFTRIASCCLLLALAFRPDVAQFKVITQPQSFRNQIGQVGGTTNAVAVQGHIAYFGIGPRLFTADLTDPTSPVILGASLPLLDVIESIAVAGDYTYVGENTSQISILATTPASNPRLIGYMSTPGTVRGLAVRDNHLFVANGANGGIQIADISDPAHPVMVGSYDTPGSAGSLVISDGLLYLADGYGGIAIFDITDPRSPTLVGACCGGGSPRVDLALSGDHLFVIDGTTLTVIDVSNPTAPVAHGSIFTPGEDRTVAARGHLAYVGTRAEFSSSERALRVIDCSDPDRPVEVGYLGTPGEAADLAAIGEVLYLADGSGGLRLIAVSSPTTPIEIGTVDQSWLGTHISLNHDVVYIAGEDSLQVITVADSLRPKALGSIVIPRRVDAMTSMGSMIYVAAGGDLHVIDARDPASPIETGNWDPPYSSAAFDVAVRNNLAFVVTYDIGLHIVDVSDPTSPQETSFLSISGAQRLAINDQGTRAYIASTSSLSIVDISDPFHPSLVASYPISYPPHDMTMARNRLYTVESNNGLLIYDASNPARLEILGALPGLGNPLDINVSGSFAYISSPAGLVVGDVSNPTAPSVVEKVSIPGSSDATVVAGHTVYAAAYRAGFVTRACTPSITCRRLAAAPREQKETRRNVASSLVFFGGSSARS